MLATVMTSAARIDLFVAVACVFAIAVLAVAVIGRYWRGTPSDDTVT